MVKYRFAVAYTYCGEGVSAHIVEAETENHAILLVMAIEGWDISRVSKVNDKQVAQLVSECSCCCDVVMV